MKTVLRTAWVVTRKELKGGVRDKRSLFSAFLFPILGPIVMLFTFSTISDVVVADETPLAFTIEGAASPELTTFLERAGAEVEAFEGDVEKAIETNKLDFILRIPDGFAADLTAEKPARLEIVSNPSNAKSRHRSRRAKSLLRAYATTVTAARMRARGLNPSITSPFVVTETSVVKDYNPLKDTVGLIGTFLLLAGYIGGMYLAIDITTGERERGSLEALLSTAVPRLSIVLGKTAAIASFAFASTVLTLTLFFLAMSTLPMEKMGVTASLNLETWSICILLTIPWIFAAAAIQQIIGAMSRSLKEAQMLLSLLMLAPMLPSIFFTVNPTETGLGVMAIPGLAQQELVLEFLTGGHLSGAALALSISVSALVFGVASWASHRHLGKEKAIFAA